MMTDETFVEMMAVKIEEAFLTTGLRPVFREWGDAKETGCAIVAWKKAGGSREMSVVDAPVESWSLFWDGVILGFDANGTSSEDGPDFCLGREVGHLVRERIRAKAPVEKEVELADVQS